MLILSVLDYGSCVPFRVLAGDFVLCSLLCPRSDSPHQGIFLGNHGEFNSGGNPTIDLRPIQGVCGNTPSRFMLQKPGEAAAFWANWLVCKPFFS